MKTKPHILNVFPNVNLFKKYLMFPIKNVEDLQNLNALVSLENQEKVVRLQDKLGEQNHRHDRNKFPQQKQ